MKNINIILVFLLLNSQFLIAQSQNRTWTVAAQFDDNLIKFNPAPVVNGLLCPNGSFLSESINSIQDANGNLLFYIHDGAVFDKNSLLIDQIISPFFPGGGPTLGYPETGIIPVPGNCNQYYILGGGITQLTFIDEHPVPVYVILDMSLPNPNFPGGGYSQFGAFIGGATATVLSNYPNTSQHVNTLQLAVSKLRSNTNYTKRFVFISENSNLYRYDFSASGFSNFTNLGSLPFGNNSNHLKTEMELVDNPSGGYRLAVPAFASGLAVNIFDLDAAGNIITSSFVSIPVATEMKGIEFSPNAQYLYFTCNASPFIGYIDLNAGVPAPVTLGVANATDFKDSEIEIAYDNKMYFASDTRFASLSNTNNPNSANWTDPATPSLNFGLISSSTYFCKILGDQIDGEDYSYQLHESIAPGSQAFCESNINSTTINGPLGYSAYHWFQSATNGYSGTQIFGGQNLIINASNQPGPYPSTYYYYLEFENSNGCRGRTNVVSVTINPSPVASITVNPGNNICAGSTTILNAGSCGGCGYVWHDQNGVIAGATSSTYTTGNAGSYYVIITNAYGCPAQSNTQVITVIPGCCTVAGATTLNNHVVPTGTTENYSGNIVINGTFNMNFGSTVNFNPGCIVTLSANAKINVMAATLNIDHATLKACYYMWDGIYLNNVGFILPHLNISNTSSISDAVYAVHSDNAADIHVSNSTFDRNYVALHLYTADYSACNISFNTFSCSSALNPTTSPAPPVGGGFTYAHADISTITNSLIFDHNNFLNGDYGIYSFKSTVVVSPANSFTEHRMAGIRCIKSILTVNDKNNFVRCPAGINATDFSNISVFDNNDFIECNAGIYCNNYVETYVDDNTFRRNWIGVYLFSSLQTITVTHNRIYDPKAAAIYSGFNTGSDQIISFNHIRADALPITPNGTYGIYLASNQNNQRTIYVEENVIENYGFGIWCSMNDYPYLHLNTIVLPPNDGTAPIPYRGILCRGGKGYSLVRNDVTGDDELDPTIAGIHIFNCDKVDEFCNNVHTLGNGLLWEGANLGPNVYGNDMSDCDNDLYLLNYPLGLGTQGVVPGGAWFPLGIPSDNKWNGNATNQTMGDASNKPSVFGYTNFINRTAPPFYNPTLNFHINLPSANCTFTNYNFSTVSDICDYVPDVRAARDDKAEALRIAADNNSDSDYEALNWLSKKYLYELLNDKPEMLTDTVLQNEQDSLEQTPIKDFSELADTIIVSEDTMQTLAADTALQAGIDSLKEINADEMGAANNAIAAQITAEQNLKDVTGVYLITIAVGLNQLDAMQRFTLEYIASQCPYTGGNAVFTAQNILAAVDTVFIDYSHNCDGITFRKAKLEDKEVNYQTRIYPNPSSGNLNCDYTIRKEERGILILRDVSGRIVKDIELTGGNHSINVAMYALEGGVYSCEIYSNGSQIFRDKIIFIK